MNHDFAAGVILTAIRCCMLLTSNKSLIKSFAYTAHVFLLAAIFLIQPMSVQAKDFSNKNKSPEEIMLQLKERLKLTEEQETKIRPIIEDSIKKRNEILNNGTQDGKTKKSALQELQWSIDMQLGKILTEEQMKEYQKLREEESEKKPQRSDMQRGRGTRTGGMRGF